MGRPPTDRVLLRQRILDAADEMLRDGYRNMTIDALAAAAGISKGAVYLHFASKEEIAIARIDRVIEQLLVELRRIAISNRPATDRLREMLLHRILFRLERVRAYRETIGDVVEAIRPGLLQTRRLHYKKEAAIFAAVIRSGIAHGQLRRCPPARTAQAFIAATNSLLPAQLHPDDIDERVVRPRVQAIADLLLFGIAHRQEMP